MHVFCCVLWRQRQNIPDALVRIVVRPMVCRPGLYTIHIVQALSRHDESELLTSIFRPDSLDAIGSYVRAYARACVHTWSGVVLRWQVAGDIVAGVLSAAVD